MSLLRLKVGQHTRLGFSQGFKEFGLGFWAYGSGDLVFEFFRTISRTRTKAGPSLGVVLPLTLELIVLSKKFNDPKNSGLLQP